MTTYTRPTELHTSEGCLPDATTAPLDDWRYRFGPLQEREQKRQYATSQNQALAGLMWTYTLLGADAKQLASYNGIQGAFCGQLDGTVQNTPSDRTKVTGVDRTKVTVSVGRR